MKNEINQILILGQPIIAPYRGPNVDQLALTVDELNYARDLIPICDVVIYCPDRSYLAQQLSDDIVAQSRKQHYGRLKPLIAEWNLDAALLLHLHDCLKDFREAKKAGTKIIFCFPEDYPEWQPIEQALVTIFIPELHVFKEPQWSDRLQNKGTRFDFTGDSPSMLAFEWTSQHWPHLPSLLGWGEYAKLPIIEKWEDLKGQMRLARYRYGSGELYFCPETYLGAVMESLGVRKADPGHDAEIEDQAPQQISECAGTLMSRLGDIPDNGASWNQALGWEKQHHRRTGIQTIDELARFVDHLVANKPAERFRAADSITAPNIDRPIVPDSVRSALARKMRDIPNIDPALARFLKDAIARITACIDYSRSKPK